jgi:hypothetical protein
MGRRISPAAAVGMLIGAVLLAAAVVLSAPQARAGGLPAQKIPTTETTGSGATTNPTGPTIPITTPSTNPAPATTRVTTATTIRPVATTAHGFVAPVATAPQTPFTGVVAPTTTVVVTTTTIAGIGGRLPAAPVTLPLRTTGTNGHVNPVFAWLAGIGFAVALALVAARLFITRSRGRDRAPLA